METFILNKDIATTVAQHLLHINAVKLAPQKPFQWSSGWLSPIYCDNRLTLSYPHIRKYIKECLIEVINTSYGNVEAIVGVATAGIPQGVLIADALNLPFLYVRSSSKKHGLENQIEGKIVSKQKVVVIEDLLSTGKSALNAIEALRRKEVEVLGLTAIFSYGLAQSYRNFQKANVNIRYLSDYEVLIKSAVKEKYILESDIQKLLDWQKDPEKWSTDNQQL